MSGYVFDGWYCNGVKVVEGDKAQIVPDELFDSNAKTNVKADGTKVKRVTPMPDHSVATEIVVSMLTDAENGCIKSMDEIDAVGRQRGAGLGGGHDEREQTLNQLLVEMDGFGTHDGIIVIAATNRPDILDPALLRPGRFDRQITVNYPDIKGREEILHVHARGKKFEPEVDFATIAKTTAGFTGADLQNLLNEAALLAVRRGKSLIGMEDIEDSFIKVIAGPQKKSMKRNPKELRKTAYHEAGHALVSYLLPTPDPVHQISVIPRGMAAGFTMNLPQKLPRRKRRKLLPMYSRP